MHYLLTKFKEHDVPLELAAIPLLESGLNAKVRLRGAVRGAVIERLLALPFAFNALWLVGAAAFLVGHHVL